MSGDADEHRLDEAAHESRRQRHAREALETTSPAERPRAILLAGQPGAGKSALRAQALREAPSEEGAVLVDIDELRVSHPAYRRLSLANDRAAAGQVQHDAGRWGDELIHDAAEARRNIVVDGTLKSPDKAEALCRDLKARGYHVEVWALAVRREDSELGVHLRYERQKAKGKPGRWPPEPVRDAAYEGMPRAVDQIERSGAADRVRAFGRATEAGAPPRALYDSAAGGRSAAGAIAKERARKRLPTEQAAHDRDREELRAHVLNRDPELIEPESRRAMEIAKGRSREADALDRAAAPERDRWGDRRGPSQEATAPNVWGDEPGRPDKTPRPGGGRTR